MDTGSDKVKYEFDDGNLNYEDQITYDEDCLLSPRITKAYNNSDWGMDWKLSYDELGRYSGRKENFNFMFGTCPDMSISYKRGTLLKEQIEYQKTHDSTTHKERIKQEYDARGNILSIEDTNTFSKYYDNFGFLIDVMPEYISGRQAEIFVAEIIQSVPETMSKTRRLKEIKAKIRNAFHVEDRKYPRWAQDTDWPFSQTGKPLKYIARKMNGDLVQHTFIDVDTGEETIVEEFY